jgi:CRP/FNR family transcriptional regulator, cyclic AMP receptor protein
MNATRSTPTRSAQLELAVADHPFFSTIPRVALRRLAAHARRVDVPASELIFREGDEADTFYLVRRGVIRLDAEASGPAATPLETLGADTVLGWSWLFAPYRWHLSATAVTKVSLVAFDASVLRILMSADPVVGYELMRRFAAVMFDRLQAARHRLSDPTGHPYEAGTIGPWAGRDLRSTRLV